MFNKTCLRLIFKQTSLIQQSFAQPHFFFFGQNNQKTLELLNKIMGKKLFEAIQITCNLLRPSSYILSLNSVEN